MNDMAICEGKVGWIYGFGGGDKCNNCVLRDIKGEIIRTSNLSPKTPSVRLTSLKLICHNNNWQYAILTERGNKNVAYNSRNRETNKDN